MRLLVLALAIVAAGCGDATMSGPEFRSDVDDVGVGEVSYAADVKPIFTTKCVRCHFSSAQQQRVDLMNPFDAERGVVNFRSGERAVVVPGSPEESFLVDKITRRDLDVETEGESMPRQIAPLTAEEIAALRTWIADGAHDDDTFQQQVKPLLAAKCHDCHNAASPSEPNVDLPFDESVGLVDADAGLWRGKRIVPYDPDASLVMRKVTMQQLDDELGAPMPFDIEPLSVREIATVIAWVEGGARND